MFKVERKILKYNPKFEIIIKNYQYLDVTYSHIQSLDYLVSFKLHPSLVGIRNNIPTLCLSKLSKVKSLLQAFHLTDFYCDYEEEEEAIKNKLEQLLLMDDQRISKVAIKVKEKEKLSDESLINLRNDIENFSI